MTPRDPERTWLQALVQNQQVGSPGRDDVEMGNGDRVSLWLMTAEGRAAVRAILRRYRLPEAFDSDLIDKAIHAAELMEARGEVIELVPAWTRRTLRLRATDLLKSPGSRRATPVGPPDDTPDLVAGLPDPGDDFARVAVEFDVVEIRRHLGARWVETHPWRVSASLTYLSITMDGGTAGRRCPRPASGADEYDAAHWAGLYYAGLRDVFPGSGEDTPAMRQRRKRRIDEVRKTLIEAHAGAGLADDA